MGLMPRKQPADAGESPPMNLQTIEIEGKTYALVSDGKPLYKGEDGKDVAFDAPGTVATISRLNGEARGHRERAERAEGAAKVFDGLDPAAAREAIEKLSKIDAKTLVAAGDMDAAILAAIKPYADKLALAEKTNSDLGVSLSRETVGNRFAMSKFAAEKLTPAGVDLVRTIYADRLKVEDGRVHGVNADGSKMLSIARPGEVADFDEVIESFVASYPHKEHILKASGAQGSGAQGGGGQAGAKTMSRSDFDALPARERAAKMATGLVLTD
jgi:hypothetical protein